MESVLANVSLFTTQTQALFMSPLMLGIIILLADETKFYSEYNLRRSDMIYFLIYAFICIIPQLAVNIFLLHTLEIVQGVKLFDYFTFAAYRYRTRTSSWLNSHWPLDRSISHAWRSLDQMCFSSQFYFVVTVCTWGIIMFIIGLTIILEHSFTVLADPYIFVFLLVLLIIYVFAAYLLREFCKMIELWEISKRDAERHIAKLGMCPLDYFNNERILIEEMHHEVFKEKFLTKNKEWLVHNLKTIIDKGDPHGMEAYQNIVNEGAKLENKKNEDAKAKRNRAMLPYNKDKDREDAGATKGANKLEVSEIVQADFPQPHLKVDPSKFDNQSSPAYTIFKMWHQKALVSIKYQGLVANIHTEMMESKCVICGQRERLQIGLGKSFDQIFQQYQRETVGMPFDAEHWQGYYRRHQRFSTICAECAYVNNVMQTKLTQYNYILAKKPKQTLARVLNPNTMLILNLWRLTAKKI